MQALQARSHCWASSKQAAAPTAPRRSGRSGRSGTRKKPDATIHEPSGEDSGADEEWTAKEPSRATKTLHDMIADQPDDQA